MIQLENKICNELAGRFGVGFEDLKYLGGGREDSDGIVYTFEKNQKKQVLKICVKENQREVERVKMKLEFARYLGESGVPVVFPNYSEDGTVFQIVKEGKYIYYATIMDYIEGSTPKLQELDQKVVTQWGKMTGKMHAVTKKYHIWDHMPGSDFQWGIEQEIDFFYHWCRNDIVKEKWIEIRNEMGSWEKDRNSYGLIHNDNHQNNILLKDKELTLIDFDCAECTYLLQDLFVPVQGLLFDQAGGFERPITDMESIKRFFDSFLAGYETENHIEDIWLTRFETLLNYRRLLLYTVMQEWMEADEKIRNSFLGMIQNPCEFSILR